MKKDIFQKEFILPKLGKKLIAFRASSSVNIDKITDYARQMSKGTNMLMILNDAKGVNKMLVPAYINAILRYNEKSMHAESLSIEMMLFMAGTMNIGNALGRVAATNSRKFIIFSNNAALAKKVMKKFNLRATKITLTFDLSRSTAIAVTAIKDRK